MKKEMLAMALLLIAVVAVAGCTSTTPELPPSGGDGQGAQVDVQAGQAADGLQAGLINESEELSVGEMI